jgi:hypothetical protein
MTALAYRNDSYIAIRHLLKHLQKGVLIFEYIHKLISYLFEHKINTLLALFKVTKNVYLFEIL